MQWRAVVVSILVCTYVGRSSFFRSVASNECQHPAWCYCSGMASRRGPYLALNPPQTKPQTNAIDRLRTSFAASTPTPNTLWCPVVLNMFTIFDRAIHIFSFGLIQVPPCISILKLVLSAAQSRDSLVSRAELGRILLVSDGHQIGAENFTFWYHTSDFTKVKSYIKIFGTLSALVWSLEESDQIVYNHG